MSSPAAVTGSTGGSRTEQGTLGVVAAVLTILSRTGLSWWLCYNGCHTPCRARGLASLQKLKSSGCLSHGRQTRHCAFVLYTRTQHDVVRSALCAPAHLPVFCLLLAVTARVTVACGPSSKLRVLWWCCSACRGAWRPPCRSSSSSQQLQQPCTGAARGLWRQHSRQRCSEWRGWRTRPFKTCGP